MILAHDNRFKQRFQDCTEVAADFKKLYSNKISESTDKAIASSILGLYIPKCIIEIIMKYATYSKSRFIDREDCTSIFHKLSSNKAFLIDIQINVHTSYHYHRKEEKKKKLIKKKRNIYNKVVRHTSTLRVVRFLAVKIRIKNHQPRLLALCLTDWDIIAINKIKACNKICADISLPMKRDDIYLFDFRRHKKIKTKQYVGQNKKQFNVVGFRAPHKKASTYYTLNSVT